MLIKFSNQILLKEIKNKISNIIILDFIFTKLIIHMQKRKESTHLI